MICLEETVSGQLNGGIFWYKAQTNGGDGTCKKNGGKTFIAAPLLMMRKMGAQLICKQIPLFIIRY